MTDTDRTLLGRPTPADPNRTVMGPAPSLNATVTIKPVQCPVCKSFNPPGLMVCGECGLIFELALEADAFGAPSVRLPTLLERGGREHPLRPGVNVVGRQGDVCLEDTRVSRRHCQITVDPEGLSLEDLGSTNGTSLNGRRLQPGERVALQVGDGLSLGGLDLSLTLPGDSDQTVQPGSGRTTALPTPPTVEAVLGWLVLPDREVPLRAGTLTFGRREENDVVIPDPFVSGQHGQVETTQEGVFITDLGSTNGTLLNGAKLTPNVPARLAAEDTVRLGEVEVRLRLAQG